AAHRRRPGRVPRRGGGVNRLQGAPVRLPDHRLAGGHRPDHARGDPRLLPVVLRPEQRDGRRRRRLSGRRGARADQAPLRRDPARRGAAARADRRAAAERRAACRRAQAGGAADRLSRLSRPEPALERRGLARGSLHDPLRGAGVAALPVSRLRAAARARGGWRLLLFLDRPEPLLVLGDGDARPDAGGAREGAARAGGAAQDRAGHRRGAQAREEPDRSGVRLPGGLDPPPRLAPGSVRGDRGLRAEGPVPREDPRRDRGRPRGRRRKLVPRRQEERRDPPPETLMTRSLTTRFALLMLLGLASPAAAAPIAHREVLPNGIVLLVAERPAVPIVAVRALVQAGAVHDPPDRAGVANLTGALLTRGTTKRTGPELDSAIEFVGGSLEAGAGRDSIGASLRVLKPDLGLGLDLLSEVILSPTFPPDEVTRKIGEIQASIKRSEE